MPVLKRLFWQVLRILAVNNLFFTHYSLWHPCNWLQWDVYVQSVIWCNYQNNHSQNSFGENTKYQIYKMEKQSQNSAWYTIKGDFPFNRFIILIIFGPNHFFLRWHWLTLHNFNSFIMVLNWIDLIHYKSVSLSKVFCLIDKGCKKYTAWYGNGNVSMCIQLFKQIYS